jgi:4-cresol dehydrogenase (hydroxylating)
MALILPPGVSAAGFQSALRAFEGVVGHDWVLATDEDRLTYSDLYAPGTDIINGMSLAWICS